jgi:hypothetical protein
MEVRWIAQRKAKAYLAEHHRHLPKCQGAILCLGCWKDSRLVGVAFIGRPIARMEDQEGYVMEITRVATDGTRNANSKLYGVAKRVARILGARKIITKTLAEESGSSLLGAGFRDAGLSAGGEWDRPNRARAKSPRPERKRKWEADL